jgi:hypothetical protein
LIGYSAIYYSYIFDRAIATKVWKDVFGDDWLQRENGEKFKQVVLKWAAPGAGGSALRVARIEKTLGIEGRGDGGDREVEERYGMIVLLLPGWLDFFLSDLFFLFSFLFSGPGLFGMRVSHHL